MKCLKCHNTKNFIVFCNQNFILEFDNHNFKKIKKKSFNISDIYPIICGKCESEEVDFNYKEIKKISRRIRLILQTTRSC
jgi:uncharacterized CHY-type Zn-finger protein